MFSSFYLFNLGIMENKNFLVEVLTSDSEYWLVAKKNEKI
jgi:hypothetical protein